jgi:predicted SAM-dependent methyltransferase
LFLSDTKRLLKECLRVLKPAGTARMVVPDLGSLVREYLGQIVIPGFEFDFEPATNADRLMRNMLVRPWAPPKSGLLYRVFSAYTDLHSHKWMFDGESLSHHMREAGFVEVGVRPFRESRISGIEEVEIPERVLDGRGVCVEGIKPLGAGR